MVGSPGGDAAVPPAASCASPVTSAVSTSLTPPLTPPLPPPLAPPPTQPPSASTAVPGGPLPPEPGAASAASAVSASAVPELSASGVPGKGTVVSGAVVVPPAYEDVPARTSAARRGTAGSRTRTDTGADDAEPEAESDAEPDAEPTGERAAGDGGGAEDLVGSGHPGDVGHPGDIGHSGRPGRSAHPGQPGQPGQRGYSEGSGRSGNAGRSAGSGTVAGEAAGEVAGEAAGQGAAAPLPGGLPAVRDLRGGPPPRVIGYPAGDVLVVSGLPGGGKSTLIRQTVAAPALRIDSQDSRERWERRLPAWLPYAVYRPWVRLAHYAGLRRALASGRAVVVHDCGTQSWVRGWLARDARSRGRGLHLLLLDVQPAEALAGQAARGRGVSGFAFRRHLRCVGRLRARAEDGRLPRGFTSAVLLDRAAARSLRALTFGGRPGPHAARGAVVPPPTRGEAVRPVAADGAADGPGEAAAGSRPG